MSLLSFPTVILMVFLMWVGASPGGTGGGIKTTTFAIMLMNFISMAKGEKTLIIQKREIKSIAINRAFAIVMLSLLLTGFATSMILYFDPQFYLDQIVFEVFSAFSTTGLSLGVTSSLSDSSKLVLIFVMFVGRVGTVTFLSAFIFRVTKRKLKYPIHEVKF
jgi:Trk-type K+ transport system membrane component